MGWTHGQKSWDKETQADYRKRGRPQIRWEDCLKKDRKADEEEHSRKKGGNREIITAVGMQR